MLICCTLYLVAILVKERGAEQARVQSTICKSNLDTCKHLLQIQTGHKIINLAGSVTVLYGRNVQGGSQQIPEYEIIFETFLVFSNVTKFQM